MPISKIGSKGVKDAELTADDIAPGTITSAKIAPGTIASDRIAPGTIANDRLANNTTTINGTSIALGASGDIVAGTDWQAVVTADGSTATNATAGQGFFIDTSSATHTLNLPSSPSRGDTIEIRDYAGTFGSQGVTIGRGGSNIGGTASDVLVDTANAAVVLVYIDATKGWLALENEAKTNPSNPEYVAATGGTLTTTGNTKIHVFNSSSNFVVSNAGNSSGSDTVSYLVVAGGGSSGKDGAGGGGGGGFREGLGQNDSYTGSPLRNPSGLPVSATTYPITVGAGGSNPGTRGSNSIFSTITSTGGGAGDNNWPGDGGPSNGPGGSGGGARANSAATGGTGNTPPVSPSQGNPGGTADPSGPNPKGAGGGGAGQTGNDGDSSGPGGGGNGATTEITNSSVTYAGGGGGGQNAGPGSHPFGPGGTGGGGAGRQSWPGQGGHGSANTGGGAGGGAGPGLGGDGGSDIVVVRYRYQ
jgi:hypothetical protein